MLAKIAVRPSQRRDLRIEKHGGEPLLQDAAVTERLFEPRLQGPHVQQGLVDVADDHAWHAVSLSLGEPANGADRVRPAAERGAQEHASVGHGFARSRSNGRSVTVQVSGTDCGVKHTLSSHA
jgi:hypothetical protein